MLGPTKTERNEPQNVRVSCEKIAEIKNKTWEEIQIITTKNAERLWNIGF